MSASERLFNNDALLEFFIHTTDGFAIVNENGVEIFRRSYPSWEFEGAPIILETRNGNLLLVTFSRRVAENQWEDMTTIYALPGFMSSGVSSTSIQQLGNPFPNPAVSYIHLPYTLPEGVREGTIRVFDAQGRIIQSLRVNNRSEYVRLNTSRLPAGSYFFSLEVRGQQGEAKQFVVR